MVVEEEIDVNNFTNEDKQILIQLYTFPTPASDMVWLNILLNSIKEILVRDYFVGFFDSTKKTRHYYQFSGGGDLYITKRIQPQPLVFLGSTQTDDEDASTLTTSTSSPPTGNSPSRPPDNVSPVSHGTSKLAGLSIEGKKEVKYK